MKKFIIFLLLIFVNFITYAAPEPLDQVVAVVNDQVVTSSELSHQIELVRKQLETTNTPIPEPDVLRKQVLQHLIDVDLQLQVAKTHAIEVDDVKLDDAIRSIAKKNNLTLTQMREEIEKQGTPYEEYRTNIRTQMILSQLQQKVIGSTVAINDEQVSRFMKTTLEKNTVPREFHVQNILIPLPEAPSPQAITTAKQLAEKVLREIKQGGNFSEAAVTHSAGSTALEGGDLGWRQLASLPEVFAKKVTLMHPGDIVGPIQTPNGFHIIKLVETRSDKNAKQLTHQEAKQMLYAQRFEEAVQNWVQTLRSTSYVKVS